MFLLFACSRKQRFLNRITCDKQLALRQDLGLRPTEACASMECKILVHQTAKLSMISVHQKV